MNIQKIEIAINQLERVHIDMNDCANRFILKDAIDQLQEQVKLFAIPFVSGSALDDGERMHYDSLRDCCNKILDAVDAGKVPQRAIMGLRLLMNR